MNATTVPLSLLRASLPYNFSIIVQTRSMSTRVKSKWASKYKPIGPSHLALEFMDAHYPRLYGQKKWTMMRCAMLSRRKYAMLFNTYLPDNNRCHAVAIENGAQEIMSFVRQNLDRMKTGEFHHIEREVPPLSTEEDAEFEAEEARQAEQQREIFDQHEENGDESLDFFLPPKKIYYRHQGVDLHADLDEAKEAEMYEARKAPHRVVMEEAMSRPASATFGSDGGGRQIESCIQEISPSLQVAISGKGNVETFPEPYHQFNRLGYYLFDAASVLPVVALDVKEGEIVGDLCAAPGGKTLALMFSKKAGKVYAVDKSWARMERFREVMFSYLPKELFIGNEEEKKLEFLIRDTRNWRPDGLLFDKVLVDVPCSNDRLSVTRDEDNVYAISRTRERESLPEYQALLLYSAYNLCKPGGYVVYSTCSLSPSQNDGVVRRFFEQYKKLHPKDGQPIVSNLESLTALFAQNMNFFTGCQYGIQVMPTLRANFGPMYICRIRKPEKS